MVVVEYAGLLTVASLLLANMIFTVLFGVTASFVLSKIVLAACLIDASMVSMVFLLYWPLFIILISTFSIVNSLLAEAYPADFLLN